MRTDSLIDDGRTGAKTKQARIEVSDDDAMDWSESRECRAVLKAEPTPYWIYVAMASEDFTVSSRNSYYDSYYTTRRLRR